MPIDVRAEPALKLAPVLDDLSRYDLKVTGLAPGNYEVKIDGEPVTQASEAKLAAGLNLSDLSGPVTEQGRAVLSLVFQKNDVFFRRWRDVQLFNLPVLGGQSCLGRGPRRGTCQTGQADRGVRKPN